ncbi:hypothetical protein SF2A_06010 [Shigella flexneri G1663]|nr:hypothetical protein SF2A_06010 [Shigella flexneri G1663]EIE56756.1 hypothetical protein ECAI27_10690 [Escherichia coli AI27]
MQMRNIRIHICRVNQTENVFSAHSQAEMGIMAIYTAAKRFFA